MWKEIKAAFFIIVVIALTIATAHAQRKFVGTVVDVIDGRTCVIELPAGRVTAVLQYVETPDPAQPFHEVAKSHLRALIGGRNVEFAPRIVMSDRTVGQLVLGGIDIGQQMLRDGAAWHSLPEKSGQEEYQRQIYEQNEALAKSEKRGVWSIEQLKPTWEYRAEQEALAAEERRVAIEKMQKESIRNQTRTTARPVNISNGDIGQQDMWADFFDENQIDQPLGIGNLRTKTFPQTNVAYIRTPFIRFDMPSAGFVQQPEIAGYEIHRTDQYRGAPVYWLVIGTYSAKAKYVSTKSLTVIADGRKMVLPRFFRFEGKRPKGVGEALIFTVSRAQLEKIAAARTFKVELAGNRGDLTDELQTYVRNLMTVAGN
jgi:endonuclease YncB( thermonuclease family)